MSDFVVDDVVMRVIVIVTVVTVAIIMFFRVICVRWLGISRVIPHLLRVTDGHVEV